tara:strand:- start:1193 stop:1567 length:375 start_codon:yes stop_codon:yes gene_type:complete
MRIKEKEVKLLTLIFLIIPLTARAEVSDKIILPDMMLAYVIVLGSLGFFLNKKWPLFSPVVILITGVLASGGLATVYDTHIGPAAIKEQGQSYVYFAYIEFITVLVINLIGCYLGFKSRNNKHA